MSSSPNTTLLPLASIPNFKQGQKLVIVFNDETQSSKCKIPKSDVLVK